MADDANYSLQIELLLVGCLLAHNQPYVVCVCVCVSCAGHSFSAKLRTATCVRVGISD